MRVEIVPRQSAFRLDGDALVRYAEWIMEKVDALDPERRWTGLSLVCMDDAIRELKREWFGRDESTDVISFAYPPSGPWEGDTGEVFVNVRRAREEGAAREGPDHELALYIAHGCHHLAGAEDDTPEKKHDMLTLETAWVREAGALGLLGPFFP